MGQPASGRKLDAPAAAAGPLERPLFQRPVPVAGKKATPEETQARSLSAENPLPHSTAPVFDIPLHSIVELADLKADPSRKAPARPPAPSTLARLILWGGSHLIVFTVGFFVL
jgi:hypothetical protein